MLTTNELVEEKMKEAGHICLGFHPPREYAGAPFSTGRQDENCAPITDGKQSVCDANKDPSHRALCCCEGLKIDTTRHFALKSLF